MDTPLFGESPLPPGAPVPPAVGLALPGGEHQGGLAGGAPQGTARQVKSRIRDLQEKLYRLARTKYAPDAGPVPVTETLQTKQAPILVHTSV